MEKKLVEETKQLELDLNDERLRYQNLLNEFSRLEERYDDLKEEMTLMVVSQILLPISIKYQHFKVNCSLQLFMALNMWEIWKKLKMATSS